jgi:hypothetical protein
VEQEMSLIGSDSVRALSVNNDGSAAAVLLHDRVIIIALPTLDAVCEIPLRAAVTHDVQWLSDHLLVAEVESSSSRIVLWKIAGETIAVSEKIVQAPLRLLTALGNVVLAMGPEISSASVLRKTAESFSLSMFPTRRLPSAVGQCHGKVLVGHQGFMEEWDLAERTGGRTWKLAPSTVPLFVGGTERVLWLVAKQNLRQLDVVPLINRGQTRQHMLPEAISNVIHHRRVDWLLATGTDTGRLYLIDLEGKAGIVGWDTAQAGEPIIAALYSGRGVGCVQAAGGTISLLGIDSQGHMSRVDSVTISGLTDSLRRLAEVAADKIASDALDAQMAPALSNRVANAGIDKAPQRPTNPPDERVSRSPAFAGSLHDRPRAIDIVSRSIEHHNPSPTPPQPIEHVDKPIPVMSLMPTVPAAKGARVRSITGAVASSGDSAAPSDDSAAGRVGRLSQRLGAWRDKHKAHSGHGDIDVTVSWRDQVGQWWRDDGIAVGKGSTQLPLPEPIARLINALGLTDNEGAAIAHLYGAYLHGFEGASRLSLAQRLDGNWNQALGHGRLADFAIVNFSRHVLTLASCVTALLDDTPIASSRLLTATADGFAVTSAVAVIIGASQLEGAIARVQRLVAGPLLLVDTDCNVKESLLESQIRYAVAVVDARSPHVAAQLAGAMAVFTGPALIFVASQEQAEQLHLAVVLPSLANANRE